MIHILQTPSGGYRDITQYLVARGAKVTVLGGEDQAAVRFHGKSAILRAMLSPHLLKARGLWTRHDTVLAIGWQALSLQMLIKLGVLPRPAKFLVLACFVHNARLRKIINRLWRLVRGPGLGFVTFSQGESRNLIEQCGIAPENVHFHLWRQDLDGRAQDDARTDDGSIFAGGYSNRDYELLQVAAADLPAPLVIVASMRNGLAQPASERTKLYLDLSEPEFEALLARCRVVAMPLRSQGEACGQSVLLRVLRNGKPMIATRHESIEAYLGRDYPGFVPPGDVEAMRAALSRALTDAAWRAQLSTSIEAAARQLDKQGEPGADIERFLLA
ncbi:glycosyltransferase [Pseudoduganella chitinolytica]|uniref:Glycosyltransferase n=1 Tax=Pseudoduganella chitinolytica TaxID=34070 RepID=A0ABY8BIA8_9BURK|nr:glycosyltransferase [Pseudoduganella chitinolytica]WEF35670.1 glycosyltransferase [Pseudoduganella chitinolytica]